MNLVLKCVLKCFFVGGGCYLNYNKFCGVQFGSGANPGGHVTVSFGATVIFVWMAPWSVSQHPPLTFQVVCE